MGSWELVRPLGRWVDNSHWRHVLLWKGFVEAALFFLLFPGFCHCAFLYDSEAVSQATLNGSVCEPYKCFLFKLYFGYLWPWWKVYSQVGLGICKGHEQGNLDCRYMSFLWTWQGEGMSFTPMFFLMLSFPISIAFFQNRMGLQVRAKSMGMLQQNPKPNNSSEALFLLMLPTLENSTL